MREAQNSLGDTTTGVTPATNQGIGGSDDVPVKEARSPYLARHECTTKDANEETDKVQAHGIVRCAGESSWNGTREQQSREGQTRTEVIAHGSSNEPNQQCCNERNNIRVGDLILRKVHVRFDALA
jgi:hypothetical protein